MDVVGSSLIDHLFSPAARQRLEAEIGKTLPDLTANELVPLLRRERVQRAVVLSAAYSFGRPDGSLPPCPEAVSAENDWIADEIAKHPDRLVGFFSVNPLCTSSLQEVERCARSRRFAGLKLHLANSNVGLRDEGHLNVLTSVFGAANLTTSGFRS